jgi:hypothetical protein
MSQRLAVIGVEEQLESTLGALKEGIGAEAVAVFDDDRAGIYISGEASLAAFWDAFRTMPCLEVDWGSWYRDLRGSKRLATRCRCGRGHALFSFLIHERWALLVVAGGPLVPGAESVMASAAHVIAGLLPATRVKVPPGGGRGGGGGPGPARVGIPLWWVLKS